MECQQQNARMHRVSESRARPFSACIVVIFFFFLFFLLLIVLCSLNVQLVLYLRKSKY